MLAISPFLVSHFNIEKESISVDILKPESEKLIRKRVLPPRIPVVPQVAETEASPSSPASPTSAPEVSVPKAPVHADVIPDVVTMPIFRNQMLRALYPTPVLVRMAHSQVLLSLRDSEELVLGDLGAGDAGPADMGTETTSSTGQAHQM